MLNFSRLYSEISGQRNTRSCMLNFARSCSKNIRTEEHTKRYAEPRQAVQYEPQDREIHKAVRWTSPCCTVRISGQKTHKNVCWTSPVCTVRTSGQRNTQSCMLNFSRSYTKNLKTEVHTKLYAELLQSVQWEHQGRETHKAVCWFLQAVQQEPFR